jgi:type IV secretory pathway VirB10-like protein
MYGGPTPSANPGVTSAGQRDISARPQPPPAIKPRPIGKLIIGTYRGHPVSTVRSGQAQTSPLNPRSEVTPTPPVSSARQLVSTAAAAPPAGPPHPTAATQKVIEVMKRKSGTKPSPLSRLWSPDDMPAPSDIRLAPKQSDNQHKRLKEVPSVVQGSVSASASSSSRAARISINRSNVSAHAQGHTTAANKTLPGPQGTLLIF